MTRAREYSAKLVVLVVLQALVDSVENSIDKSGRLLCGILLRQFHSFIDRHLHGNVGKTCELADRNAQYTEVNHRNAFDVPVPGKGGDLFIQLLSALGNLSKELLGKALRVFRQFGGTDQCLTNRIDRLASRIMGIETLEYQFAGFLTLSHLRYSAL